MTPLTGNILVVDDDDDFRQRMSSILTREGLTVRTAASAAEALDHLSNNIDLIILDTVMPVRDGYRFLQDLRSKGRSTPVIMVGDNQPQDKDLVVAAVGLRLANFLFKTTLNNTPPPDEYFLTPVRTVLSEMAQERRKSEFFLSAYNQMAQGIRLSSDQPLDMIPLPSGTLLTRGDISIDLIGRKAYRAESVVPLTSTTFEYLAVLARHAPAVIDYVSLVSEAQGYQNFGRVEAQELCKYHIHELRQAIEPEQSRPQLIVNHRGRGYALSWNPKASANDQTPDPGEILRQALRGASLAEDDDEEAPA